MVSYNISSAQDLFNAIHDINVKFYKPACENVVYLEELCDENFIAYMVSLRDAFSHIAKIFEYADFSSKKEEIYRQLDRYSGHLERVLFDTYQKIISVKSRELWSSLPKEQIGAIKTQIAKKIVELRIVSDSISIDEKIEGYKKIY